ncbi:glycine--tRNA ligase subunit beta [Aurantiacibacter aquimixticola]|uniref:Glycine--tRNA ligase beta subunit n=1 Tax=Aurantiacibacter aquimixticola TaxID=1958945 RepID=A0A419RWJ9_9SPHN|nr:glycine--tRNA ligase subunit beta [Aurantiacibacter aquimixticola]RJY10158.1 glycine--tRNA ligase subunit beta [Aurantiacibacter aquimixticola]
MSAFLLELRSEEIPARMQAGARAELEKLFRREMEAAGVSVGALTIWSTPRRLALIARDLPDATEAVSEEAKGPPVGAPDQAVDGFCRKLGVTRDDLETRDVKGRETYFAMKNVPGRAMRDLLAEAIPTIIRDFSWPKSMRWGAASISTESLRWVRPLSGIMALLGDDVVECEVHGVTSGAVTLGHRFHHQGDITIGNADDYAMKLRAGHVIVDHEERATLIRDGAAKVASEAGLKLVEDEVLVVENAGLTEWPVPLLGRFEDDFLDVPPEVIQLTARVNQKYFVCENDQSQLANAFICTANIAAEDPAVVVEGNRKVLAARLSDARFFWEMDRKTPLREHAKKLERITFHEKLGTVADKVERVAKLARWLVEEGIVTATSRHSREGGNPSDTGGSNDEGQLDPRLRGYDEDRAELADLADQAARLAKADLVTEMVGEFPELQGLMGGYYARAEGLPDEVADAIRDHYKPVGQGDDVPTAPVTVAVSLADKLDTLFGFFAIDEKPTGSKDPFALRRAGLAIIASMIENDLRFDARFVFTEIASVFIRKIDQSHTAKLGALLETAKGAVLSRENMADIMVAAAREVWKAHEPVNEEQIRRSRYLAAEVYLFLFDRLKVQQREAGVRHDLIDAVFALGGEDDLVRLLARVHALQSYIDTDDGENLLAGYKRAANILKKEDWSAEPEHTGNEDPLDNVDDPDMREIYAEQAKAVRTDGLSYTPEPAEKALIDALDAAEPKAEAAIAKEDFAAAMAALASLRSPIDAFFDEVTVNDEDPARRSARLSLLDRFRAAVHQVADFSKIEG